jgi:hypothetical protein
VREVGLVCTVGLVFAGAPARLPRLRRSPLSEEEGGESEEEEGERGAAASPRDRSVLVARLCMTCRGY